MPTHLSWNKITYADELSLSSMSEQINCISNLVSMGSFNSSSDKLVGVSVVEPSRADKLDTRDLRTSEIDLWNLRLRHPNMLILKNTLMSCNQFNINKIMIPSLCNAR